VRVSLAPLQPVANATRIGSPTSPNQDSEDTTSR
jgi:hypothetical protein